MQKKNVYNKSIYFIKLNKKYYRKESNDRRENKKIGRNIRCKF